MATAAPLPSIVQQLRKDISVLEGHRMGGSGTPMRIGLQAVEAAFPNKVFSIGAVHEFISPLAEHAAAANGFIAGILSHLLKRGGICLWIGRKALFPPTLHLFGIEPDRVIFIDLSREKEVLWTVEEALKCDALSAVVGELQELTFTESRRLQLAVEESKVTGFIHRYKPRSENVVACQTRWKIKPLPSFLDNGLPGVGFPRWNVQLAKVRNGTPGSWNIEWHNGNFRQVKPGLSIHEFQKRKTG